MKDPTVSDHAALSATPAGFLERHHFLLRRLHSLSGIVPVGLFVIMHLFTNFQILAGNFQHEVEFIHSLPTLLILEISIWGGIGFHAALGLVYTFADNNKFGVSESSRYKYTNSWRYTLQRVTGILALIFIFLHVATLRWRWNFGGWFTPFFVASPIDGRPLVAATTAAALQGSTLVLILYIVGVASVIYHWCNGLWTAAITWGLTVSTQAMRRWGYVCAGLAAVLTVFSAGAIVGSLRYEITPQDRAGMGAAIELYKTKHEMLEKAGPLDPRLHLDPGVSPDAPAQPQTAQPHE
jgi:succinate dehydrogenase / fumarate reductase, cytochrome b subunit